MVVYVYFAYCHHSADIPLQSSNARELRRASIWLDSQGTVSEQRIHVPVTRPDVLLACSAIETHCDRLDYRSACKPYDQTKHFF